MLAIVFLASAIPADFLLGPTPRAALLLRFACDLILLALLVVTRRPFAAAAVFPLALAAVAAVGATLGALALLAAGPNDPYAVLQQAALLALVAGTGSMLPLAASGLTALLAAPVAMQAALAIHLGSATPLVLLFVTVVAYIIAVVAGDGAFRVRRTAYETRIEKEAVVEEKQALLESRARFVAMLSHDMKNPLGAVLGFTDLLREQPPQSEEERREMLDDIEVAARRALRLAVDFVDATRIEQGRLEIHRVPASLNEIVERVLRQERAAARSRRITLEARLSPDVPVLALDPGLLERVVANLVGNALKFPLPGTRVRVATARRGAEVVLTVADQGPGVPAEERARLFEPFRAGRSETKSSGLGLFIVKSVVEAHGGRVTADDAEGGGSVFAVSLPCGPSAPLAAGPTG